MFFTPEEATLLSMETGLMLAEAQMVVAMRLWGMAGVWNVTSDEPVRMVQEKAEAAVHSLLVAGQALMGGQGAGQVAMAALAPVRDRTRDNVQRLGTQGLRTA